MAYKTKGSLQKNKLIRDIEQLIYGGDMKCGTHEATITDVTLTDTYATIEFSNTFGESSKHNFFFQNFDRTDLGYLFKQLVTAVVEDADEIFRLQEAPEKIEDYKGTQVSVVIEGNGGLKYQKVPEGFQAGRYVADTLTDLQKMMTQDGLKLYRNEVKKVKRYDSNQPGTNRTERRNNTRAPNSRRPKKLPAHLEF